MCQVIRIILNPGWKGVKPDPASTATVKNNEGRSLQECDTPECFRKTDSLKIIRIFVLRY
jgi:hypothetical protein